MLGYAGPPVVLASLLLEPPHSLVRQSWAPRLQTHGVVNADGFGVGWYDRAMRPEPAVYRSARPMWGDRNVASLAGLVRSGAVLAAVRSATPPLPVEETGAPPFVEGRYLFAHNGAVPRWLEGEAARLRRALSDVQLARLEGATDSEVLFRLVVDRLDAGASAADALRSVASLVGGGRLTMMLHDGERLTGLACGEPLFVRADGGVIASEPFDDASDWEQVADGAVVSAP